MDEADVLVIFHANPKLYQKYYKSKIIIRCTERLYKSHKKGFFNELKDYLKAYIRHGCFQKYKPYLLTMGAYTYGDYMRFHNYKDRAYKFGYLTYYYEVNIDKILEKHGNSVKTILWFGNFHVQRDYNYLINAVAKLTMNNCNNFNVIFIGDGIYLEQVKQYAKECKVLNKVSFLGAKSFDDIKHYCEESQIFVSTGGRIEGFNVGLLTAMNYGCICFVRPENGSTLEILKDYNGFIYHNDDELYRMIKTVLNNDEIGITIGRQAILTIKDQWNGKIVVSRLSVFLKTILVGDKKNLPTLYQNGPLSPATFIKWSK